MHIVRRTLEKLLQLLPPCRAQAQHSSAGSQQRHGALTTVESRFTPKLALDGFSLPRSASRIICLGQPCCFSCPTALPESCLQQKNSWRTQPDVHQLAPTSSLVNPADETATNISSQHSGHKPVSVQASRKQQLLLKPQYQGV